MIELLNLFPDSALVFISSIDQINNQRQWIIYAIIFLLTFIEGPIATLSAAGISATGLLNPFLVFLFAATGNLTADFGYYFMGRLGKFEMIEWVLKKINFDQSSIALLRDKIVDHSAKTIFIAKISNSLIVAMLITMGTIKIPLKKWAPGLILGECVWSTFLMVAGYFFSNSIQQIENGTKY
nr:VTT domain-containing protein [Anaerolineaceae bacterium]